MTSPKHIERADAFLARLLRLAPDIRAEKTQGEFGAVASYHDATDRRIFSFCLDGLLIDPDGAARYISYLEISTTSYYGGDELMAEKSGDMSREITLNLHKGEAIILPLRKRSDQFSERLRIGDLIENRVRLARANSTRE